MRNILLLLLLPFHVFAQDVEPVRHINFVSRQQSGFFAGAVSVSPRTTMVLATFNDFAEKAIYELVRLADGKLLSSGSLTSIPYSISWSEDEQLVAMRFKSGNSACYDAKAGMKLVFSAAIPGEVVFSRNRSLLNTKSEPLLYVFGDDVTHIYTAKGVLKDSADIDGYHNYAMGWFDLLHNRFNLVSETNDELFGFSVTGKAGDHFTLTGATDISGRDLDNNGAKYLCHNDNILVVYDAGTGKIILNYPHKEISSACFTPDGKNIILTDKNEFRLIDLTGKQITSSTLNAYYSDLAFTGFGTELIGINPTGVDFYTCKNYFPVRKDRVVQESPVVVSQVTRPINPAPPVKEKPIPGWTLPYRISDFITPMGSDSFYLYNADRTMRYYIVYGKLPAGGLWANPYKYFQYFGFSNEQKYQLGNIYTLEMLDGEARIASYYQGGLIAKDAMIGGSNFLGKIPMTAGQTETWPMHMYDEQYSLSAKVVDNMYKGKKAKCLTVTRVNGVSGLEETYYYQQGIGLVRISSQGKTSFER